MADRVYKGKLTPERHDAFSEAATAFDTAHAGGLVPFDMLKEALGASDPNLIFGAFHPDGSTKYELANGSIWLTREDAWIKIDPDGTIEIGIAGV